MNKNKLFVFIGVLLLTLLFFVSSVFASENEYPEIPIFHENQQYVIYNRVIGSSDTIILKVFFPKDGGDNLSSIRFFKQSDTSIKYADSSMSLTVTIQEYVLRDGSWSHNSTGTVKPEYGGYGVFDFTTLLFSTVDVYSSSTGNEIFFQKTPLFKIPTVEEMIMEETPKMGEKIIKMMKTILLCGVGCLALLISLPVLLKVFYRFRLK